MNIKSLAPQLVFLLLVLSGDLLWSDHCFSLLKYIILLSSSCSFLTILQAGSLRGDSYLTKLRQLESFMSLLVSRSQSQEVSRVQCGEETEVDDRMCCICYACDADAGFVPCAHRSCYGCITRHLLNCHRCFFCNATVLEVVRIGVNTD